MIDYSRGNRMAIIASHPGEHLALELGELGMSAAELARQLNVPTNRVTEILNRRRGITGTPRFGLPILARLRNSG